MAARETSNLAQAAPRLAQAFARAKQLYIERYPKGNRPYLLYSYRSPAEQDELFAQGRTKPGQIVTYKRGGESKHNTLPASAIDIAFVDEFYALDYTGLQFRAFAEIVHEVDPELVWGGNWHKFKDLPHFELPA